MKISLIHTFAISSALAVVSCSGAMVPAGPNSMAIQPAEQSHGLFPASLVLTPVSPIGSTLREIRAESRPLLESGPNAANSRSGLYVSQFYGHGVYEYLIPDPNSHGPICDIYNSEFVNGLGVDASGTVWVPLGNDAHVRSYAPRCGAPGLALFNPHGQASDVAFNNKTGTIYVDNAQNAHYNEGFINVYPAGQRTPSATLKNNNAYRSFGIAVNSGGNLFQSFTSKSYTTGVLEYQNGSRPGKVLALTGLEQPGGLTFDSHDNLLVADAGTLTVQIFAPPYSGGPTATISMKGTPVYAKLNKSSSRLYVSNYDAGSVDVYTYPAGTYLYSISKYLYQADYVEGIAIDPSTN